MSTSDPFDEMERLFDRMRRSMWQFDDAPRGVERDHGPNPPVESRRPAGSRQYDTTLDVEASDDGYVVYADLPGFETSDIDLRFDEGTLTIEAVHAREDESSARHRRVSERVHVPGEVREDETSASYHNGVLEVHLPTADADDEDATRIDIE